MEENKMKEEKNIQRYNKRKFFLKFIRTHHILGGVKRMGNSNVLNPIEVIEYEH